MTSIMSEIFTDANSSKMAGLDWTRQTYCTTLKRESTNSLFFPGLLPYKVAGRISTRNLALFKAAMQATCHAGIWAGVTFESTIDITNSCHHDTRQCDMLEYFRIVGLSRAISRCGLMRSRRMSRG